jgi:hypothetical protein
MTIAVTFVKIGIVATRAVDLKKKSVNSNASFVSDVDHQLRRLAENIANV